MTLGGTSLWLRVLLPGTVWWYRQRGYAGCTSFISHSSLASLHGVLVRGLGGLVLDRERVLPCARRVGGYLHLASWVRLVVRLVVNHDVL